MELPREASSNPGLDSRILAPARGAAAIVLGLIMPIVPVAYLPGTRNSPPGGRRCYMDMDITLPPIDVMTFPPSSVAPKKELIRNPSGALSSKDCGSLTPSRVP